MDNKIKDFETNKADEVYTVLSGDFASGKSTFFNAFCGYPICPCSVMTTSICPIELRKASQKDEERIEICLIDSSGEETSLSNNPYRKMVFRKQILAKEIFDELCNFVQFLDQEHVTAFDHLKYFDGSNGDFCLDRFDWRQTMCLLMVLFDTYLHEDKEDVSKCYKIALERRNKLFDKLGLQIFKNKSYGICLYLDSDSIPLNTAVVKLPTNSPTKKADDDYSSCISLAVNYLSKASSMLFMVSSPAANISLEAKTILDLFIDYKKQQKKYDPETITFLINKADRYNVSLLKDTISVFRENYPEFGKYAVYAISARSGEFLFLDSGVKTENTKFAQGLAAQFEAMGMPVPMDYVLTKLKNAYFDEKYPFHLKGDASDFGLVSFPGFFEQNKRRIEMAVKNKETIENKEVTKNKEVIDVPVVSGEPEKAENCSSDGLDTIYVGNLIEKLVSESFTRDKEEALKIGIDKFNFKLNSHKEIYMALCGDVSGGKSTFFNVLCRYPVCPSAEQTTSICPVELRKASGKNDERIEICIIETSGEETSLSTDPKQRVIFRKQTFTADVFEELCDFAQFLVQENIISIDHLKYFDGSNGDFCLDRFDWRQTMCLLMVLFDTYLHEDKEDVSKCYKIALERRNKLFDKLGLQIFKNKSYGICLYWDSDLIPLNTVIVDLPGTGNATNKTEDGYSIHTSMVVNYLHNASSMLFMINQTGNLELEAETTLNLFIDYKKQQKKDGPEMITFLMNKADGSTVDALKTSTNSFRSNYPELNKYAIYAVSARSGEFLFLDSGVKTENTKLAQGLAAQFEAMGMPVPMDNILTGLKNAYFDKKYPFHLKGDASDFGLASLSEFINEHVEEFARRLSLRSTLSTLFDYSAHLANLSDKVMANAEMIISASGMGSAISSALEKSIMKSLEDANNSLYGEQHSLTQKAEDFSTTTLAKLNNISESFNKAYAGFSKNTNIKIKNMVSGLETQRNGTIPFGDSFIGNSIGIQNKNQTEKFLIDLSNELAKDLTSKNNGKYFGKCFAMLEEEFQRERDEYHAILDKMCEIVKEFPEKVKENMEKSFKTVLENKKVPQGYYQRETDALIKNTYILLKSSCKDFVYKLKVDTSFVNELAITLTRLHRGLSDILSPYTKDGGKAYAYTVTNSIVKFNLVRANVLSVSKMEEFLSGPYVSDFSKKLEELLKTVFKGTDTTSSHTSRITKAIAKFVYNVSSKQIGELQKQVENACSFVKGIKAPSELYDELEKFKKFAYYIKSGFMADGNYAKLLEYAGTVDGRSRDDLSENLKEVEQTADNIIEKVNNFKS